MNRRGFLRRLAAVPLLVAVPALVLAPAREPVAEKKPSPYGPVVTYIPDVWREDKIDQITSCACENVTVAEGYGYGVRCSLHVGGWLA